VHSLVCLNNVRPLPLVTAASSIELHVAPEQFFRIDDVERFADGSGYVGRVSLRSGSFALHSHKFYFENLNGFLSQTRRLYETLSGTASIRQVYERNHISITATSCGHLCVAGHFAFFDGESQRLEFSFIGDQTFLPPFIRTLEQVCRELDPKD
jgi:hypothetical protein